MKRRKTSTTARKAKVAQTGSAPTCVCDDIFDVSIRDFGRVKRVWSRSANSDEEPESGVYTLAEGRTIPSEGPISRAVESHRTCVGVVRSCVVPRALEFVAAKRIDDDTVRVNVYQIDEHFLSGFLAARVASLTEVASLTRREREVLELMLLGRSARDIAAALKISHSTAKFHQTNVLDKLGAESRFDLFRVLG